jgi:hypothetical protein
MTYRKKLIEIAPPLSNTLAWLAVAMGRRPFSPCQPSRLRIE